MKVNQQMFTTLSADSSADELDNPTHLGGSNCDIESAGAHWQDLETVRVPVRCADRGASHGAGVPEPDATGLQDDDGWDSRNGGRTSPPLTVEIHTTPCKTDKFSKAGGAF